MSYCIVVLLVNMCVFHLYNKLTYLLLCSCGIPLPSGIFVLPRTKEWLLRCTVVGFGGARGPFLLPRSRQAARSFSCWAVRMLWSFICFLGAVLQRSISCGGIMAAITFHGSIDRWSTMTFYHFAICCWTSWPMLRRSLRLTLSLRTAIGRCVRTCTWHTMLQRTVRMTFHWTAMCTSFSHRTARSTWAFICQTAWLAVLSWTPGRCVWSSLRSTQFRQTSRSTSHRTTRAASSACIPFSDRTARPTWAFLCPAARSRSWNRAAVKTTKQQTVAINRLNPVPPQTVAPTYQCEFRFDIFFSFSFSFANYFLVLVSF